VDARRCLLTLLSVLVVVSYGGLRCFPHPLAFSLFVDVEG